MKKKRKNKVFCAGYLFYKRGWRKPMNAKTNQILHSVHCVFHKRTRTRACPWQSLAFRCLLSLKSKKLTRTFHLNVYFFINHLHLTMWNETHVSGVAFLSFSIYFFKACDIRFLIKRFAQSSMVHDCLGNGFSMHKRPRSMGHSSPCSLRFYHGNPSSYLKRWRVICN